MRKRINMIFLVMMILLIGAFTILDAQDSQVRPKKEFTTEFVLDANVQPATDIQIKEEPGAIIQDMEGMDPVGDWLSQFAWYQRIERFLPGLILLGLLLGKVAKYTPGKQDDLISGALLLIGRLLRKTPKK